MTACCSSYACEQISALSTLALLHALEDSLAVKELLTVVVLELPPAVAGLSLVSPLAGCCNGEEQGCCILL
jgi:hypothetical protein